MTASISIKLIPSIQFDSESNLYSARFKEFPVAIVNDDTREKAILRLIHVFEVVVNNEREYIIDTVNRMYGTSFKYETCIISFNKKTVFQDHHVTQEYAVEIPMVEQAA